MGKLSKLIFIFTIILFASCSFLYPSIRKSKRIYLQALNSNNKSEQMALFSQVEQLLNDKIKNGFADENVYINYINSEYQMALLQPQISKKCYEKAAMASSIYVKKFPNSPLSNYYKAKSLYLLNEKNEKVDTAIKFYAEKAINLMNNKFLLEKKELEEILKDLNDNHN